MIELSVIIVARSRGEPLRACLEALARQGEPATDVEVIVVLDQSAGGVPRAQPALTALAALAAPYSLRVVECGGGGRADGQAAALNAGAGAAAGAYCLFLDDDVVAGPGLLAEHLRVQRERGGAVGVGDLALTAAPGIDAFSRYCVERWDDARSPLRQGQRLPSFADCDAGHLSVPREAFTRAGGFASDMRGGEGAELACRVQG
ncbi:MAG: glycosyltransferase, partial [Gemmatimonadaceae bacterium]